MRREIVVTETPTGWLNNHTGRLHNTAVNALRSIKRQDASLVDSAGFVFTKIIWEPTTQAGRIVTLTLASE